MKHFTKKEINLIMKESGEQYNRLPEIRTAVKIPYSFTINSLEGRLEGKADDYIVKGIYGEYYICDSEIFKKTYDKIK